MKRDAYPLEVHLPDGTRARVRIVHIVEVNDRGDEVLTQLVQHPPQYERRDGTTVPIDVTIPDDLAAAGWYWSGSFLYQPWPEVRTEEQGRGPGVAIATCTYGPPGYPSDRQTCFEIAHELERKRTEIQVALRAKPPKKVRAGKKTIAIPDMPIEVVPEPELAYEQAELML